MDPATDPRLQQYPLGVNVNDFSYPSPSQSSIPSSHYDPNLQPYALNLHPGTIQGTANVSPQRTPLRNNGVQASQRSPQVRMQARQAHPTTGIAGGRNGIASNQINRSPRTQQQQTTHNLVYKNPSINYANNGGIASSPQRPHPLYVVPVESIKTPSQPPTQTPTSASYFSTPTPQHQLHQHHQQSTPLNRSTPAHNDNTSTSSDFPLIPNPPNLAAWREKLFNITSPLVLSETEYLTYFPHIDNVYSHRSTQKYKRKPFVSHYWDCRLKGRPSGTKKSDDPNKKKRKRTARERDLCDVKIKVTEWFGEEDRRKMGLGGTVTGSGGGGDDDATGGAEYEDGDDDEGMNQISGQQNGLLDGRSSAGRGGRGLTIVMEDGTTATTAAAATESLASATAAIDTSLSVGMNAGTGTGAGTAFGMLEPAKRYPQGHPGAEGKRWFVIQRVNGSNTSGAGGGGREADDESNEYQSHHHHRGGNLEAANKELDHKHTLEESDRIKKNSVQRWLLKEEKEKRSGNKNRSSLSGGGGGSQSATANSSSASSTPTYLASGLASQTAHAHRPPAVSDLTLYANSFCPYAQRVWIALEIKQIPYQFVEVIPQYLHLAAARPQRRSQSQSQSHHTSPAEMLEVNAEGVLPCIRHGNWGIWESGIMMEYLEDLSMGHSLLPLGSPQLRAHCRLWTDHINRKILPAFYALLLTPTPRSQVKTNGNIDREGDGPITGDESTSNNDTASATKAQRHSMLVNTLQAAITKLVNASHAMGPFFLGADISYVDVNFAPWIIRLSRVLSYYRNFPRPEVGTRWQRWVDAVESDDRVRRTVSDEGSYHGVYRGVGEDGRDGSLNYGTRKAMVEFDYARAIVGEEGFGLGGDLWGRLEEESGGRVGVGVNVA